MKDANKNLNKICFVFFILNSLMIFYNRFPQLFTIAVYSLTTLYSIHKLNKELSLFESLYTISILTIPCSFVSILSTDYGDLPLTWHNIAILSLFVLIFINGKCTKKYMLHLLAFIAFSTFSLLFVDSILDAAKQILTILLFYFGFFIGEHLKSSKKLSYDVLFKLYLSICCSVALQIIIQSWYIEKTNNIIGNYVIYGGGREAYSGLMGDNSFANLFLASGCFLIFLIYIELKKVSIVQFIAIEMLLLYGMLTVSARTGFVALAITFMLYYIRGIKKINFKLLMILVLILCCFPILLSKLMAARGGQALTDSSGRLENYKIAFDIFKNHLLIGKGFGLGNLGSIESMIVPHNFFIQYLVQCGVVGFSIIIMAFITFLKNNFKYSQQIKWVFILIAVGSMFIPDIVSSRFLYAIITIMMISTNSSSDKENVS